MRLFLPIFVLLVALALVLLSTPRLIASALKAPGHATISQMNSGETPPPAQLTQAASHLDKVRGWENSAWLLTDLGFLRLLQAAQTDSLERQSLTVRAADDFHQALIQSPARPHPWVRLAYAESIAGSDASDIVAKIKQSISVGAFVSEIALVRLRLLLQYWDQLPPQLRIYTTKQIRYMWSNNKGFVLRAARETSRPHVIRFALRPFPRAVERVDAVLSRSSN